ncbi:MAG: lmo0937 family membrane protein [Acidobacteriia bacterium]|nr:lmo0937 family membrane protein [Terriglobia bacterium]
MLLLIGIVLFVLWILGFAAFHVAGGLIHLLLVFAVISIIWHLVAGRRATV